MKKVKKDAKGVVVKDTEGKKVMENIPHINLSQKQMMMLNGFSCTKDCAKIISGTNTGWFEIKVNSGATALIASAAVTVAALLL
jgi:hypothetical protein